MRFICSIIVAMSSRVKEKVLRDFTARKSLFNLVPVVAQPYVGNWEVKFYNSSILILNYRSSPRKRALDFASEHVNISADERQAVINSKHSLLFSKGQPWEKRNSTSNFDVTIGSYDGAETCELVGCYLLSQLKQIPGIEIGLYRDNGLAIPNQTPREIRKQKNKYAKYLRATI